MLRRVSTLDPYGRDATRPYHIPLKGARNGPCAVLIQAICPPTNGASLVAATTSLKTPPRSTPTPREASRNLRLCFSFRLTGTKTTMLAVMDPLHATIEDFAADANTHIQCYCPRCGFHRLSHRCFPQEKAK